MRTARIRETAAIVRLVCAAAALSILASGPGAGVAGADSLFKKLAGDPYAGWLEEP